MQFSTAFIPCGPKALAISVDIFAFAPFLTCFVIIGPDACFLTFGVASLDAKFAVGTPIEEPFAFLFSIHQIAFHIESAFVGPPSTQTIEFVVAVCTLKLHLTIFMPFFRGAFTHTFHKRYFVFLLAVFKPRFIYAVLLPVHHSHFTLEFAVFEPRAGSTVGVTFFGTAFTIFIEDLPYSRFLTIGIGTLLINTTIGVPPSPIARAHAVVGHNTFHCDLRFRVVVEFLVTYLCLKLQASQAGDEQNDFLHIVFKVSYYQLIIHSQYPKGSKLETYPFTVRCNPDRVLFLITDQCSMYCRHC